MNEVKGNKEFKEREYDEIFSFENLRKAWEKERNHAQRNDVFYDSIGFENYSKLLDANLRALQYELLNKRNYEPSPFHLIRIPKNGGKFRDIVFAEIEDRMIIQALINVIGKRFEDDFSENSFGNRLNTDLSEYKHVFIRWMDLYWEYFNKMREFLELPSDYYFVKTDIHAFYDNIIIEKLIEKIGKKVLDPEVLELIRRFLKYERRTEEGNIDTPQGKGIPQGPAYAHFFANVYLDEFDHFAEEKTVGYVRYVDDIVLIFRNKEEADENMKLLKEKLEHLGLTLSLGKTISGYLSNPELLINEMKNKKYDLALALNREDLTFERKQQLMEILDQQFLKVDDLDEISKIYDNLGFTFSKLKEIGIERKERIEEIKSLIYEVLSAEPLKPNTFRVVLMTLLEISGETLESRFIEYFKTKTSFHKICLVQTLEILDTYPPDVIKLLLDNFLKDDSYLVRAATLNCLEKKGIKLKIEDLRDFYGKEKEIYTKSKAIKHFAFTECDSLQPYLLTPIKQDNELIIETLRVLETLDENTAIYIFNSLKTEGISSQVLVQAVYLCLKFCNRESFSILNRIIKDNKKLVVVVLRILKDKIPEMLEKGILNLDKILIFAENLGTIDDNEIKQEVLGCLLLNLPTVKSKTKDPKLIEILDKTTLEIGKKYGTPSFLKFLTTPERYLHQPFSFLNLERKSYFQIKDIQEDYIKILEVIPEDVIIENPEFESIDTWFEYLEILEELKVIPPIEKNIDTVGDRRHASILYQIPEGYSILADFIKDNRLNELDVIQLIKNIFDALNSIQRSIKVKINFPMIHPFNILVTPDFKVKFINCGSVFGVPTYISSISRSKEQENNPTAPSLFLGWLSFEALTEKCPLIEKEMMKKKELPKRRRHLTYSPHLEDKSLHYIWLLKRLTYDQLEFRYSFSDDFTLPNDIKHISEFYTLLDAKKGKISESEIEKIKILDYISLRIDRILKNPKYDKLDNKSKISEIFFDILDEVYYIQKTRKMLLFPFSTSYFDLKKVCNTFLIYHWLHISTKKLLAFSIEYERRMREFSEVLKYDFDARLPILTRYIVLWIELTAFLRWLISTENFSSRQQELIEIFNFINEKIVLLPDSEFEKLKINFKNNHIRGEYENPFKTENFRDLIREISTLSKDQPQIEAFSRCDLKVISAFLLVFGGVPFTFSYGKDEYAMPYISCTKFDLRNKEDIWFVLKILPQIEEFVELSLSDAYTLNEEKTHEFDNALSFAFYRIRNLNKTKRKKGKISKRYPAYVKEGFVELGRFPIKREYKFGSDDVISFVRETKIKSLGEIATVDIQKGKVINLTTTPSVLISLEEMGAKSVIDQRLEWVRRRLEDKPSYKKFFAITIVTIAYILITSLSSYILTTFFNVSRLLSAILPGVSWALVFTNYREFLIDLVEQRLLSKKSEYNEWK